MFAVNNMIYGIARVLEIVLQGYMWIVIISALISWINPDPYNPIVRTLRALTEPLYYRIRKVLPFTYSYGMDFSPIVVLLIIQFLQYALVRTLFQMSMTGMLP